MEHIIEFCPNKTNEKIAKQFYHLRNIILEKENTPDSLTFEDWMEFRMKINSEGKSTLYGLFSNNNIIGNIRTNLENRGEKDEHITIFYSTLTENIDLSLFSVPLKNWLSSLTQDVKQIITYTGNTSLTNILLENEFVKIDTEIFFELQRSKIDLQLLRKFAHPSILEKENIQSEFIQGICKDEDIKTIAELWTFLLNEMPRKDKSVRLENSFEHLKTCFERDIKANTLPSTIILRNAKNEAIGMSFTVYNKGNPVVIQQLMTGVLPAYRNKGLSKWMKAHSYITLLDEYSSIEKIKTSCIEDNIAMINLNKSLAFDECERTGHYKFKKK